MHLRLTLARVFEMELTKLDLHRCLRGVQQMHVLPIELRTGASHVPV